MMSGAVVVFRVICIVMLSLATSACFLLGVERQTAMLQQTCLLGGTVSGPSEQGELVVVVLQAEDDEQGTIPMPVDFALADDGGGWQFALDPGKYSVLAFHDANGNLVLDDGEPAHRLGAGDPLTCAAGSRLIGYEIIIDIDDRLASKRSLAVTRDGSVFEVASEIAVSIGQLTAYGVVISLDDSRFDLELAKDSLWRPMDFIRAGYSGIYLLEPLDQSRIPVLFVHGINGSPRVLETPIERLDTELFQPMLYYYPSGLRLEQIARHLYGITRELEVRHGIDRMYVVAHSMGGLVAQAWLLQRKERGSSAEIPVFISLSAPWLGNDAARVGADYSPVVVPVWRDMASGSEFVQSLFGHENSADHIISDKTQHHLLFSYRQDGYVSREAGDGVATLASMLAPAAQQQAASVYGVNSSHVGILESEQALQYMAQILEAAAASTLPLTRE